LIFSTAIVCRKQQQTFEIRHGQIDELLRTKTKDKDAGVGGQLPYLSQGCRGENYPHNIITSPPSRFLDGAASLKE